MKIGFCTNVFRADEMDEAIAILGRMGYDGIEIWQETLFQSDLARLKANLAAAGIEIAQQCAYFDFTGEAADWEKSIETNKKHVELAQVLGGNNMIRVFTGEVGSAEATEAQWAAGVRGLKEICRAGAQAGLSYALETHIGSLMDTAEATKRLLDDVGAKNLGVNLQIPMSRTWEPWEPIVEAIGDRTVHLHVHNWKNERCKARTYLADGIVYHFPSFLKALIAKGFDGYVSLEHARYRSRWEVATHELGYLKGIMDLLGVRKAQVAE